MTITVTEIQPDGTVSDISYADLRLTNAQWRELTTYGETATADGTVYRHTQHA